jgi:putative glutathione S-transferase
MAGQEDVNVVKKAAARRRDRMGQLVDGKWVSGEVLRQHDEKGVYFKHDAVFRQRVTADGLSGFPAASGRYHLYSAVACPWAHRAVLFRVLKGLTPHVALWNTSQEENGEGWGFGAQGHVVPGTDARVRWLHELYTIAEPACTTRVTVPTLWDAQTRKVVSNESSEIIRMFNSAFGAITGPTADYYPQALRREIDDTNAFVLKGINNAVNGCGYSITQAAYDEQVALLFASLDVLEERLARGRYLCGEAQTEADWRLFPSLVRFDAVYYVAYKCNLRRLEDYHNLSNYLRELYQVPGIAEACDIAGMKRGVYSKAGPVGANGIVPAGPLVDHRHPHDRERFAAAAPHKRVYARL